MSTPWQAYIQQRTNANRRGIDFFLTFKEWWNIWEESGHYYERGRGSGKYVMHRTCDDGAYEVGNVEIVSAIENFRLAMDAYYGSERSY